MDKKQSAIVLIFNTQGKMALQLRAADDARYPLHWDFSAGGGIDLGEDHRISAVRETKKEIGVDVEPVFMGEEVYRDSTREDHLFIYKARHNGPFTPQPEEVKEIRFFSIKKIERMLKSGEKFHPEFPMLWGKGYIQRATPENLEQI